MHVIFHLSKFYDWVPVPRDVAISPEDIASGRVMPDRSGGYRVRKAIAAPGGSTPRTMLISEQMIINKIVHEKADVKRAGRTFSRKESVAHVIQDHLSEGEFEWNWIQKIEVHDDGHDEVLFRKTLGPLTTTPHGRRAGMIIPPEHHDDHVAKYTEACDHKDHVAHLSRHYGVASKTGVTP